MLLLQPLTTACGYRMTGGEAAGHGSGDSQSIKLVIGSVDDRSRELLLGALVRQGLARRGMARSDVTLLDGTLKEMDGVYVLSVELGGLSEDARAYTVSDGSREYILQSSADATVKSAGKTVWLGRTITARREFARGEDVDAIAFNKERALKVLADDLAGEIMRRALLGVKRAAK